MLVSRLLSGNGRLQKCSVENPSHVQNGDKGEHVRLIQLALMVLDNADIADSEFSSSTYGPTTKDAVLAYKTKRSIINYSYQSKADAVVGIMTVRAMDAELAAREFINTINGAGRPSGDITTKRG